MVRFYFILRDSYFIYTYKMLDNSLSIHNLKDLQAVSFEFVYVLIYMHIGKRMNFYTNR